MKKTLMVVLCLLLFLCVGIAQAALAEKVVLVRKSDGTELAERYEGLADAIKAASGLDNPTYVLLSSFPVGKEINLKDATLDMGGFSLYVRNSMTFTNVKIVGKETTDPKSSLKIENGQGTTGSLIFNGKVSFENVRIEGLKEKLIVRNNVEVKLQNSTVDLNEKFIEVKSGGTLIVDGSTIKNGKNLTTDTDDLLPRNNDKSDGKGGAIYAQAGAKVTINESTFENNEANYGGAIFIYGNDEGKTQNALVIENSTFTDNRAEGILRRGGAIYISKNKVRIDGTVFKKNKAYHGGGAIFLLGKSEDNAENKAGQLEVYGTDFIENESGLRGGAITVSEFSSAKFLKGKKKNGTVGPTVFDGNYLTDARDFAGGALFIDRSFVYMEDMLITGNEARDAGGGISTCSTGTADIRPLNGAMIYGNSVSSEEYVKDGQEILSDIYFFTKDHLDYYSQGDVYVDGRDNFSTVGMKYELHEQMFNGHLHYWKFKEFFTDKEEKIDGEIKIRKLHSLIAKSNPDNVKDGVDEAQVIFRNNKAVKSNDSKIVSGGAIADNGLLEIGSTTKIRIVKVWESDNASVRPSEDVLLEKLVLYKNGKNGPISPAMGSLKTINQNSKITVKVLTGEGIKDILPYSNVVLGKNSVIGQIYDIDKKEWIVPLRNVWVIDVEGLDGNPYGYTVEEGTIPEYEKVGNKTGGTVFTNKYTQKIKINVYKEWNDDNNRDGKRPDSVTVHLLKDNVDTGEKLVLSFENGWQGSFSNLDADGDYTVEEEEVDGYTSISTGDNNIFTITNTHIPETTQVTAQKVWKDNDNALSERPEQVAFQLYANGSRYMNPKVATEANGWKVTFSGLPKYKNGKEIEYTIKEEPVPTNYTPRIVSDQNGFTVTNTYNKTVVQVEKVWKHEDNDPLAYPTRATFHLLANGHPIASKELTADDRQILFSDLPTHEGGKEITYMIREDEVPNYTAHIELSSDNTFTVINTYNPGKTAVQVKKIWDDSDNQYKNRPEQVTVYLYANKADTGKRLILSADNNWYGSFEDLNKLDKDGNEIQYSVGEEQVTGYASPVIEKDGNLFIINNTLENMKITVEKVWKHEDNDPLAYPTRATFHLHANGHLIASKELTADDRQIIFSDLPTHEGGKEITYRIVEDEVTNYTAHIELSSDNTFTVTNTYNPGKTVVQVEKRWDDSDNQYKNRPEQVTVYLYANKADTGKRLILSADKNWSGSFEDLDKLDKDGNEIQYSVGEEQVTGYARGTIDRDGNLFIINNTLEYTQITAQKVWNDNNNALSLRPTQVTFRLHAKGVERAYKAVTQADDWKVTFDKLPKYEGGEIIQYTITEDHVTNYTPEIDQNSFKVTNTYNPGKTSVQVEKIWDDSDNQYKNRPEQVTVHLYANKVDTGKQLILRADKKWYGVFEDLDERDKNGEPIDYTIKEDSVKGYVSSVTGDAETGYVLVNTLEYTEVTATKLWDHKNNDPSAYPTQVTFRLHAKGVEKASKAVTQADGWKVTFDKLPKYEGGEIIKYTITEDHVPNYTHRVDEKTLTVTNTFNPGKTDVEVEKEWEDNHNQYNTRPERVTVHLYANGADTGKKLILSAANEWYGAFEGLDERDENGEKIDYTIKEDSVKGYVPSVTGDVDTGYVLVNTLEYTEVTATKLWDHKNNDPSAYPTQVTFRLHANGVEKASKAVTQADGWKVTFDKLPKYEGGEIIKYTITEDHVPNYTQHVDEETLTVTNTYNPGKTDVEVEKKWEDNHNQYKTRPEQVTVHLYANGADTGKQLILRSDKKWYGAFEDLDERDKNGEPIDYTIKEDSVKGYVSSVTGDAETGYVLVNTLEYTEVTATKIWVHNNNDKSAYPTQVTFRLHANGVEKASKAVTQADGWKVTFDKLPKYEGGEIIKYTITEDHVPNYTHHVDEKTLTVTNTYNPGKTDVEVEKEWEDNHNQYKIRPEQITVHLYANGVNTGKQLILNAANEWYGAFETLDEMDENGKPIEYTVVEDPVEGYVSSVTGDAQKGFIIDNVLIPVENQHFMFTKVWMGGTEKQISWKLFSQEGKQMSLRFKKKKLSSSEWLYESEENVARGAYLIEDPVPGYVTQYENVGVYAKVTDRLYNGGKILNVKIPQTGDKENLWIGISLGALSLLGMVFLLRGSRKRRREK